MRQFTKGLSRSSNFTASYWLLCILSACRTRKLVSRTYDAVGKPQIANSTKLYLTTIPEQNLLKFLQIASALPSRHHKETRHKCTSRFRITKSFPMIYYTKEYAMNTAWAKWPSTRQMQKSNNFSHALIESRKRAFVLHTFEKKTRTSEASVEENLSATVFTNLIALNGSHSNSTRISRA